MDKNLKIPITERHKFSQPLGKLITGTRKETISEVEELIRNYINAPSQQQRVVRIYLVGDIVTKDFLANDFLKSFVKLCIIDEKTQRKQIKIKIEDYFEEIIEFENPEGGIKNESFTLLDEIITSNKRTLLKVIKGEEDLLVLPLVLSIPLNETVKNLVFYGQPPITDSKRQIPEGIVMVDVEKRIKKVVQKFVSLMKK
jgi:uncharacterized protein (UPF0218 family)